MLHLLRITHIVFGAFWVGSVIFLSTFLLPAVRALGPAAGPVMNYLSQTRKLPQWMITAGVLTVLSGGFLFWRDSGGLQMAWIMTPMGIVLSIGALCAIVTFIIGVTVNSPSARRLAMIMTARAQAGRPPTPEEVAEVARLQARMAKGQLAATILIIAATMAMAVARYAT